MTMQTSGPISIGQAMNECQVGGRYNAGSYALSNLAKVSPGARYAWSYWYGKSNLQPINNVVFAQIHTYVDRNGNVLTRRRALTVTTGRACAAIRRSIRRSATSGLTPAGRTRLPNPKHSAPSWLPAVPSVRATTGLATSPTMITRGVVRWMCTSTCI
jgi:hypothetical protein